MRDLQDLGFGCWRANGHPDRCRATDPETGISAVLHADAVVPDGQAGDLENRPTIARRHRVEHGRSVEERDIDLRCPVRSTDAFDRRGEGHRSPSRFRTGDELSRSSSFGEHLIPPDEDPGLGLGAGVGFWGNSASALESESAWGVGVGVRVGVGVGVRVGVGVGVGVSVGVGGWVNVGVAVNSDRANGWRAARVVPR